MFYLQEKTEKISLATDPNDQRGPARFVMTIYKQSIRLNSPRGGYRFNWSRNAGAIPFYFQLAILWTKSTRMRHISEVIAHWRWRVSGEMFNSFIWEENDTIWEKESYCYYWTEISDINFEQIFKMVVRRNHVIQIAHYSLMQILLAKGKSYFC